MTRQTNSQSGFFITLEGGEGAGKSSQITLLKEKLVDCGLDVVVTREPGGTTGAEIMRHVLLSGVAEPFGPELEALLFAAARMDHVDQVIKPALERGAIVLCDRFIDSTRIYQGKCGNVEMDMLKMLETVACENTFPDLTIVLNLDPRLGMERAKQRREKDSIPDRFEKETLREQKKRQDRLAPAATRPRQGWKY